MATYWRLSKRTREFREDVLTVDIEHADGCRLYVAGLFEADRTNSPQSPTTATAIISFGNSPHFHCNQGEKSRPVGISAHSSSFTKSSPATAGQLTRTLSRAELV